MARFKKVPIRLGRGDEIATMAPYAGGIIIATKKGRIAFLARVGDTWIIDDISDETEVQ